MKPINVFQVLARRRFVAFIVILVLILAIGVGLGANFLQRAKKAKAIEFVISQDTLVLPKNELLYVGGSGYVSQRLFSQVPKETTPSEQLSGPASAPVDHIYNSLKTTVDCPDSIKSAWEDSDLTVCHYIVGTNDGMRLKFNESIKIYGTVIINDRVVFDSPDITFYDSAKIYANGQNNQLAYGDKCGLGGIGGINGGTTAPDLSNRDCGGHLDGKKSSEGNLADLHSDVAVYFKIENKEIIGGNGGTGKWGINSGSTVSGSSAVTGVGGGGSSGPTGKEESFNQASSGGGGGGFGLVIKSDSFKVNIAVTVNASGGDSLLSKYGTMNEMQDHPPTGGVGGPGGGGVIIIDASEIQFYSGSNNNVKSNPNYGIFKVKAGVLKPSTGQIDTPENPAEWLVAPGLPDDGSLIIVPNAGAVSVKKTVTNITAGSGGRPNYVFRTGDVVLITLDVANLVIGQSAVIKDDIFADGKNLATVDSISDGGALSGLQVVWNFTADDIKTTSKTLTYKTTIK